MSKGRGVSFWMLDYNANKIKELVKAGKYGSRSAFIRRVVGLLLLIEEERIEVVKDE